MKEITCLKCGGTEFEYYESGDYLRKSEIEDGIIVTFDGEPEFNERDSGVICINCNTEYVFELNGDGRSIKSISR